jgi:hypothetical protein
MLSTSAPKSSANGIRFHGIKEILSLQQAGINTLAAEALLARMQATVDNLCAERDKLVGEQRKKYPGTNKAIKGPQMRLR